MLDLVVVKVPCVNAIQPFDISIAFTLKCFPVERGGLLDGEPVGSGIMDGFSDCSSVPGNLLRNTTNC
jgi:Na+/H+ antiporter NhaB